MDNNTAKLILPLGFYVSVYVFGGLGSKLKKGWISNLLEVDAIKKTMHIFASRIFTYVDI